jgi:2'-5' RNA ligase
MVWAMTRRFFISVDIEDEKIRQRLATVQHELGVHGHTNATDPDRFHITLNFIGDVNDDELDDVRETLAGIDHEPFNLDVNGIGTFPSENYIRVVWAGADNDPIRSLATTITGRLPERHVQEHDFHGHITLLRVKDIGPDEKEQLRAAIRQQKDTVFGSFTVDSFRLKESTRTPEGAEHTTLEEFDLQ